jgi:hypothetical protein
MPHRIIGLFDPISVMNIDPSPGPSICPLLMAYQNPAASPGFEMTVGTDDGYQTDRRQLDSSVSTFTFLYENYVLE